MMWLSLPWPTEVTSRDDFDHELDTCPVLRTWASLKCRRPGFEPWVGKIWRREWLPTPVFWPREFYGQRSLAGYSPWGCKESDFTEQLSLLVSICRFLEFFICIAKPPLVFCPVISVSSSQTWLLHWRRKWQPTPVFLPGDSQGRRSLVGCRLWGRTVRHDWSDLAAAAAISQLTSSKWFWLQRPGKNLMN